MTWWRRANSQAALREPDSTPRAAVVDAAAQLRRILLALPKLADDRPHSVAQVARAVGTDPATLVRDLQALVTRVDDVPGAFIDGVQLLLTADTVELTSTLLRRPMRLSLGELRALELGLALLAQERGPDERPVLEAARERLAKATVTVVAEEQQHRQTRAGRLAGPTPPFLSALRSAVRERRVIRLSYAGGRSGRPRRVRPYGTIAARGKWFLVGFCERTDGLRVFRVDRVSGVTMLDATFTVPAEFSLEQVLRGDRVFTHPSPAVLRVRYGARIARWIAEREGRAPDADGAHRGKHVRTVDELRDGLLPHHVAHVVDRLDHGTIDGVDHHVLHEAAVDLQVVDGQVLEIREGRHALGMILTASRTSPA